MDVSPPFVTSIPAFVPPRPTGGNRWRPGERGVVHLDGDAVGTLTVTGWDASWGFGRFSPEPGFAAYAPAFRRWSLLLHADGDGRPLSRATSDELVRAENRLDRIKARIFFPADDVWIDVFQLNIDGELLEWKEY
jgi:hypothetical protein